MNMTEILSAALFCFAMVFMLLGSLFFLIKLSTSVIRFIEAQTKRNGEANKS